MSSDKNDSGTSKQDLKDALERLKRAVKEASVDLLSLEVDSVLAPNISGVYPLDDVGFLHETCGNLVEFFDISEAKKKKLSEIQKPLLNDSSFKTLKDLCDKDELTNGDDRIKIKKLRDDLKVCLDHKTTDNLDRTQSHERSEYRRYLHYLQKYLDLHCSSEWDWEEGMLKGREHQQLRTLWELVDAAYIYAQTVMQLDGDIVFRINERLFTESWSNADELMQAHRLNVEAGTKYRNELINTFVQVIRTLTGAIFHR
ncbi:MAG: hypothetical protein JW878_02325 [Methanomicrobia archaeon]|nr:hypothetical protein [Methanomicrobia archaeon]